MKRRGVPSALRLAVACAASVSCGVTTLAHDSILGPISPAGRIHDATVGRGFEATHQGVSGDSAAEPRLRPYPADLLQRVGSPSSFWDLVTGIEALLIGTSTYAERHTTMGSTPDLGGVPAVGTPLAEVLSALGPPDRWARHAGGQALAYRSERERRTTLNVGIPPVVGFFIPIPGLSNLAYRRIDERSTSRGFVLLFDSRDRLVAFGQEENR